MRKQQPSPPARRRRGQPIISGRRLWKYGGAAALLVAAEFKQGKSAKQTARIFRIPLRTVENTLRQFIRFS